MVTDRTGIVTCLCLVGASTIGCAKAPFDELGLESTQDAASYGFADIPSGYPRDAAADRQLFSATDDAIIARALSDAGTTAVSTPAELNGMAASTVNAASANGTGGDGTAASAADAGPAQVAPSNAPVVNAPVTSAANLPVDTGAPAANPAGPASAAGQPPQLASCALPAEAALEDVSRPTTVVGDGTPASCNSAAFVAAVAKGGVITFNCGTAPATITLDQTAKVFNDKSQKVVIDGSGKVTLSGGGRVRILYQNACDEAQVWTTTHCDNQEFPQLTVQNLTFTDGNSKSTNEGGAAIYAQGGRLKVINSQFFNNAGPDVGGWTAAGGALMASQQYNGLPVHIVNSTFGDAARPNTSASGGAVCGRDASFNIVNSTLSYNKAVGTADSPPGANGGTGGAIYDVGLTFTLKLCGSTLESNSANEGGGAIFSVSNDATGQLVIEHSTLQNNPSGHFETYPGIFVKAAGAPTFTESVIR